MAPWRYPIIYVRGYAKSGSERDETAADPFCGFNLGSTVYRAIGGKKTPARKFIFESPVVRLSSDYKYSHVYQNGLDIIDGEWKPPADEQGNETKGVPAQSIIIYRYYDEDSRLLGDGKASDIKEYAKKLSDLILRVRELVCLNEGPSFDVNKFRCYLVAHSMGGLVVRAFLQNKALGDGTARACVDKVFTYATPHNGIEFGGVNIPAWLTKDEMDTFNRKRMAGYLDMKPVGDEKRVDYLPESAFPSHRFFCMVGTNRGDYEVARGLSRTFAGHGSDGLVRIENASVWGIDQDNTITSPVATAYAYRAHSGYFGIVNSEEAYQNLVRFLFGDIRIDIWLDITDVSLPPPLEGKAVEALYQFELLAAPRGKRWFLTRRVAEEDSCACRTHQQLTNNSDTKSRAIYLSTVFLSRRARVDWTRASMAYGMTVGVKVPDYQVDKIFWPDQHYEGSYLYRDTLIIEVIPPETESKKWDVRYGWQSSSGELATQKASLEKIPNGKVEVLVPFGSVKKPGITGKIRLVAGAWNDIQHDGNSGNKAS